MIAKFRKLTAFRLISEYGPILLAGILYAIALKYFVLPARVILTGTEGIATAFSYYFDSYLLFIALYLIFQAALLAFAFLMVSRAFALKSLIVVVTVVVSLAVMPKLEFAQPEPDKERIILVLFGGILAGVAKAIAFKARGSTGDEDIVAAYLATKYLMPVGSVAVYAAIVSTTFGLFMDLLKNGKFESIVNTLMYTSIFIFASTETLNNLYRKFKLTMLSIITSSHQEIGEVIKTTNDHRTFTVHQGTGGHSGSPFYIVRTILTLEELPQVLEAIKEVQPDSFYYYHNVEGVSGRYHIPPIK